MSGLNLREMEASDMMDVLHFLFEDDFTSVSEEHARSRSAVRDTIYRDMYGVGYAFKLADPKGRRGTATASNDFDYSEFEALNDVKPVDPKKSDPFSPRDNSSKKSKIKFVDADEMPLVEQSFAGLDAPLN